MWKSLTPQDKEIFPFDIRQVIWERYACAFVLGARIYLLRDDIDTLPAARKKIKRYVPYLRCISLRKIQLYSYDE